MATVRRSFSPSTETQQRATWDLYRKIKRSSTSMPLHANTNPTPEHPPPPMVTYVRGRNAETRASKATKTAVPFCRGQRGGYSRNLSLLFSRLTRRRLDEGAHLPVLGRPIHNLRTGLWWWCNLALSRPPRAQQERPLAISCIDGDARDVSDRGCRGVGPLRREENGQHSLPHEPLHRAHRGARR